MSNKEILERAIQKAIDGGFNGRVPVYDEHFEDWFVGDGDGGYEYVDTRAFIFDHDFAKALWGEEYVDDRYGTTYEEYQQQVKDGMHYPIDYEWNDLDIAWGYHLKHMVIVEDPIKYLGDNL